MTEASTNLPKLPGGWVWTTLGETIEPSKEKVDPQKIQKVPYIGLGHIEKDTGALLGFGYSDEVRSTKAVFRRGDLLYGKLRPYLNKVYVADSDGICSTDILVFPKNRHISNKFLLYRLLSGDFVRYASRNVSGVQHPRVNFNTLSEFVIPLPPLPEQQRIVAKIEELFTQLDAGVAALEKAKAQLQRYRQAVLKAGMEGELTREWRQTHPVGAQDASPPHGDAVPIEPASVLLERILEERRAKWEAEQLAKMKAKGKVPQDDKWKKKYKEPTPPDTTDLPRLPDGWVWTKVGDVYDIMGGGTPSTTMEEYWNGDVPWITSADIHGVKDIRPRRSITEQAIENSATNLVPTGSIIVVTRVGLGKLALTNHPICFSQDSQALVGNSDLIFPDYALHYLSQAVQVFKYRHRGTTIAGVTKKQLSDLPVALPPLPEQSVVVEEVERRLSVADQMERAVEQSLKRAGRLRQSILKRAFEGKLVPQDPTDEPASVLLERIKAEKGRLQHEKRPKKQTRQLPLFSDSGHRDA